MMVITLWHIHGLKQALFRYGWAMLAFVTLMAFSIPIHAEPAAKDKIRPGLLTRTRAVEVIAGETLAPQMHRIIVTLKAPASSWSPPRSGHARQSARLQQQIRTLQDDVLKTPVRGVLTSVRRYLNLHAFAALADATAIGELVSRDAVAAIYPMPVFRASDTESHPLTGTDDVHLAGYTGKGITIAIIDDGIAHDHPAFGGQAAWPNDKILGGYDFADDDPEPQVDCPQQDHGTAMASIAAGNGDNRFGITGTAPDATLVFLKVERREDCGSGIFQGDIVGALDWILTHHQQFNIKVVSMSFGAAAFDTAADCDAASPYAEAIDNLHAAGISIFAAAGNGGLCSQIEHPACLTHVISVGSVFDSDIAVREPFPVSDTSCAAAANCVACTCQHDFTDSDIVPCYSNSAELLDLLAPDRCALAARPLGNSVIACFTGSSASTQFAAGVAATLLEAAGGSLEPSLMKRLLTSTGVPVLDAKNALFKPRVDTYRALQALRDGDIGEAPATGETPCSDCQHITGNLALVGATTLASASFRSPAGRHQGWLLGTQGANVHLYLLQRRLGIWQIVASSTGPTALETVRYEGQAGDYVWAVQLQSGSGDYDFWFMQPR